MCFDLVLWQGVGVGWGVPLPKVRSPSGCGGVGGWKWLGPWGLDMVFCNGLGPSRWSGLSLLSP
jgi:hypothetical protein